MGVNVGDQVGRNQLDSLPPGAVVLLKDQGGVEDDDGTMVYGSMVITRLGKFWLATGVDEELYPDNIYASSFPATLLYLRVDEEEE